MIDLLMVRPIDSNNRLVIPPNLLSEVFHTQENEKIKVNFFVEGDAIIIKQYKPMCICCRTRDNVVEFKNIAICSNCLKELKEIEK